MGMWRTAYRDAINHPIAIAGGGGRDAIYRVSIGVGSRVIRGTSQAVRETGVRTE